MGGHHFIYESHHTGGPSKRSPPASPRATVDPFVLTFGKYRNKNIKEIAEIDPNYAKWVMGKSVLTSVSDEIKKYLEDKFKNSDGTYEMRWGKHKNKSIKWIYDNDRTYFNYLVTNEFVNTKCPALLKGMNDLMEQQNS